MEKIKMQVSLPVFTHLAKGVLDTGCKIPLMREGETVGECKIIGFDGRLIEVECEIKDELKDKDKAGVIE